METQAVIKTLVDTRNKRLGADEKTNWQQTVETQGLHTHTHTHTHQVKVIGARQTIK